MKKMCSVVLATTLIATAATVAGTMEEDFRAPPASTRPFVYWYWINNNLSVEGIRKDLQALARIGVGGVHLAHIEYKGTPYGDTPIFSDGWWTCMEAALEEAGRLGIAVHLFNSPGWSGTGGAWVKPEQAMRYLDVREYRVHGPQALALPLPRYESNERISQTSLSFQYEIDTSKFRFQTAAVQAFPAPGGGDAEIARRRPAATANVDVKNLSALFDGDETTAASFLKLPAVIELEVVEPFSARALEVVPARAPFRGAVKLEYGDGQGKWTPVLSRQIVRGENRIIASGFKPFAPVCASFPAVTARRFRLTVSGTANAAAPAERATLAELRLSGAARVDSYAEKQLAHKAAYTRRGPADGAGEDGGGALRTADVRNLSAQVGADGVLRWDVPAGDWIIQHSGLHQTGVPTHPVPEGPTRGFAADVLSSNAVQASFDAYVGEILRRIPPAKRKTLTGIVLDSYEQGSANWTDGMAEKFQAAYGYDPMPWTPALAGHVVESADQSDRFLWDLRRLVADLMPESFAGALHARAREHGLTLWQEPYAGHGFPGECLALGRHADMPAGEFWLRQNRAPGADAGHCRAGSSVAAIHGRPIVSAEAFTTGSDLYKAALRDLKPYGDWALAQGVNHFTFHLCVHQPGERPPGINTWYGTEFNRHNNWFEYAGAYVDYLRRACALLQRGRRVTDIAVYIGDDVPCDVPSLPYPLPPGYDYDFVNYDALMNRARAGDDGWLALSSGAAYRLLVLPQTAFMRPELAGKLAELVEQGVAVYGPPPRQSPSRKDFPASDERVRTAADRLWGDLDGKRVVSRVAGRGRVFWGRPVAEALAQLGLAPDVVVPEGFSFTHRREADADIYFVANPENKARAVEISFRTAGRAPELWDALSGQTRTLPQFKVENGRTVVPMEFSALGSCFVVFRKDVPAAPAAGRNFPACEAVQEIGGSWEVEFADRVGPSFRRTLDRLTDWTASDEAEVRYFCGRATYSIDFNVQVRPGARYLNLGRVESLARVRLNGREAGTLWCPPYRVDVSGLLKEGENRLEVEMVNPWWNRLIGDEQKGAVRRTEVSARRFWKASDPLLPAGLFGPVTLERTP